MSTLSKLSLESTNTPFVIRAGVSSSEAGAPATRLGVKSSVLGSTWTLVTVVAVCCQWSVASSLCRGLFEMLRVLLMSGSTHVLRAGAVLARSSEVVMASVSRCLLTSCAAKCFVIKSAGLSVPGIFSTSISPPRTLS